MNRACKAFLVKISPLLLMLALAPAIIAAEGPGATDALLNAPVPFYHTYNLTSLFPVGQIPSASASQSQAGSNVVTLQQCIDAALSGNPDYNKSRENLRAVTGDILAAWGNYLPTLRASYGLGQNNRTTSYLDPSGVLRTSGGISKSSYGNLNVGLTLFDAANVYFDMKNAHYLRNQRQNQISDSELGLIDQVRRAYFNALRQEQLLLAAKNEAERRRDALRLAEARFSVGSVTKLDVLQAQMQVKNQELIILQSENDLKTAKISLVKLLGWDLTREFSLVDQFSIHAVKLDADSLISEALTSHPQVKSLQYQIKQQKASLWMGRLAYLPVLSTGSSYSRTEDGLTLLPWANKGRGLSFSMSWNVLDSFDRFRRNRYAEVALNNLNYDLTSLRLNIEEAIRKNYLDLLRLQQRYQTLEESKSLAQQSLELQRERYRLGASSILELRNAQVDFSQAEVNLINSIYDFHSAISTLSRNVGRDVLPDYTAK